MVSSPIEIFSKLAKNFDTDNKFKKGLWPAEKEFLNLYYEKYRKKSKIGIKLPTRGRQNSYRIINPKDVAR